MSRKITHGDVIFQLVRGESVVLLMSNGSLLKKVSPGNKYRLFNKQRSCDNIEQTKLRFIKLGYKEISSIDNRLCVL